MNKPPSPCTKCRARVYRRGLCERHYRQVGNSTQRGYGRKHRETFRAQVLERDPICVADGCDEPANQADHFPLTRRQLVRRGLDPLDSRYGRGLCASHHSQHTALTSSGWGEPN
jgi:5-methylcytosine-specific restriction enzyme A